MGDGLTHWEELEIENGKLRGRIQELEDELTELRAERDAWRRSLVEEEVIKVDEDGNVSGPEELLHCLAANLRTLPGEWDKSG